MRFLPKLTLVLIALAAACSTARTAKGPRCPDGSRPRFSGHPFAPFICHGDAEAPRAGSGEGLLPPGVLPDCATWDEKELSALAGNWEGWVAYGNSRYFVLISLRQSDYLVLKISATDWETHDVSRVRGELRGSHGRYGARVLLTALPEWRLKAKAWLGKALPPLVQDLDRSFVLSYKHLAALHEVRFKQDGPDRIRYLYTYRQAGRDPAQSSGFLTRAEREPF